jgi:uncharacterized protein YjbJ (UPF0337 family)
MHSTIDPTKPGKRTGAFALKPSTRDRLEGTARTVAGAVKEQTGNALRKPGLQLEGRADKLVGDLQRGIARIEKLLGR